MTSLKDTPPTRLSAAKAGNHADVPAEVADLIDIDTVISSRLLARVAERLPEELTSTQAAECLGMSRPTLKKKINSRKIPAHKVGTHTRLYTRDVLEYLLRSHLDHVLNFVSLAMKSAEDSSDEASDGDSSSSGAAEFGLASGDTPA